MLGDKKESLERLPKIVELHSSEAQGAIRYPDEIPRIYNSPGLIICGQKLNSRIL